MALDFFAPVRAALNRRVVFFAPVLLLVARFFPLDFVAMGSAPISVLMPQGIRGRDSTRDRFGRSNFGLAQAFQGARAGVDCVSSRLIFWIALVLSVVPLGVAIYVALFEQRPFNWPVAGAFAAIGICILLVGWTVSYFLKR